jgi:hypothetical protein
LTREIATILSAIAHLSLDTRAFGPLTISLTVGKIVTIRKTAMNRKPVSPRAITVLVAVALVFTITLVVIMAVACIIGKMGDTLGQTVLEAVALAIGLAWVIDLICLVLALGVNSSCDCDSKSPPPEDD